MSLVRVRALALAAASLLVGAADTAAAQAIPHPRDVLGHEVGADRKLADWGQIGDYFTRLAASPAVKVDTLGVTTAGLPFLAVTISHPDNMRRLEAIRADEARLADPRTLAPADEARLVRTQPAVVLISNNIHGSEIGSSQMSMELAWRLATNDTLQAALRDVVLLMFPSMNPDGTQMVTEWYRQGVGTAWEGGPIPWLYHPYVGHDNNRDWYMVTQRETRLATDFLYRRWFPQVVYDVHQMGNSGMRIFVPPMVDPVNPNLDPLIVRGINLIGAQMSWALEQAGKQGVGDGVLYDLWWHGGFRGTPTRHNMVALLTEAASVRVASPIVQAPAELTGHARGLPRYEARTSFPNPWPGGTWRLRDIVEYELIAAEALVKFAARQREELVRGFVQMGRRQVQLGATASPRAFLVPKAQRDPGATRQLLHVLQVGGVEVHDSRDSWVVRMDQPYRAHAKDLLEVQRFPAVERYPGGPVERPYDVAGWTLPFQMGVRVVASDTVPSGDAALLPPVEDAACVPPERTGAKIGRWFVLDPRDTESYRLVMQAVRNGWTVRVGSERYRLPGFGDGFPAGTFYVRRGGGPRAPSRAGAPASARAPGGALDATPSPPLPEGVRRSPLGGLAPLPPAPRPQRGGVDLALECRASIDVIPRTTPLTRLPRIGLYRPWTASMDEGWTRWLFDQHDVPYITIVDSTVRAGRLRDQFDVVLVPDMSLRDARGGMPARAVPPAYAGGLGDAGLAELGRFVADGGTLLLLDHAAEIGTSALGVPVGLTTVRARAGGDEGGGGGTTGSDERASLYAPGSILRVLVDTTLRLTAGMADSAAVYFTNSVTFDVPPGSPARPLLRYPARGSEILMSGFLQGDATIAGKAAAVDVPMGRGRVILFGFRPQYRGQSVGTFKLLFNALLAGGSSGQR
ncbi:MAG TPA: M14 family metallopeptidase [Gemmatimonadaceae bacterium]|nr:M14 family metallopeptidase [Gemmatimonadaceae bacterium]